MARKNAKHNQTGTVHGAANGQLLCGSRIRGRGFHDPYKDTDENITCKICKRMIWSYFYNRAKKAGLVERFA